MMQVKCSNFLGAEAAHTCCHRNQILFLTDDPINLDLGIRRILGDIRLWASVPSTSSCLVSIFRGTQGSGSSYIYSRKVDIRLPGKAKSNSHGARLVHLIITMIKWNRTSRLSINNYLSLALSNVRGDLDSRVGRRCDEATVVQGIFSAGIWSSSEEGSYSRRIDGCIIQL